MAAKIKGMTKTKTSQATVDIRAITPASAMMLQISPSSTDGILVSIAL